MSNRVLKRLGRLFLLGVLVAATGALYMWFKPHRNVQSASAYAELAASRLVKEFEDNAATSNKKYFSTDGNSKILILDGTVASVSSNANRQKVVRLKDEQMRAGVSCTFTKEGSTHLEGIKKGDRIRVKGAITAGNQYDPDLKLSEDAVMIDCDLAEK